jgi:hypothetical protein
MLPHGNYPILRALTRILLARGEHDRMIRTWEQHLKRSENPKVWQALLRFMPYMHPAEEGARERLLGEIFQRYPQALESMEAVNLIGFAHWWAPEQIRAVLDSWRPRNDPWLQQVVGEVAALMALVQPELGWTGGLLTESMAPEGPIPSSGPGRTPFFSR